MAIQGFTVFSNHIYIPIFKNIAVSPHPIHFVFLYRPNPFHQQLIYYFIDILIYHHFMLNFNKWYCVLQDPSPC
jgi:hypothetical protein